LPQTTERLDVEDTFTASDQAPHLVTLHHVSASLSVAVTAPVTTILQQLHKFYTNSPWWRWHRTTAAGITPTLSFE
jgi:hypothetical protein